jgi:hypothetical protein
MPEASLLAYIAYKTWLSHTIGLVNNLINIAIINNKSFHKNKNVFTHIYLPSITIFGFQFWVQQGSEAVDN